MRKSTSIVSVSIVSLLLISLQGCALISNGTDSLGVDPDSIYDTIIEHTIEPGDRLVDLSTKYTGSASQWGAIAAYNNITEPRSLRIGQTIAIPYSLIPEELRTDELQLATRQIQENQQSQGEGNNAGAAATAPVSPTPSLALKRESATPSTEVIVEPVVINRTFELKPINESELNNSAPSKSEAPTVRVLGTYYPKGVYQQPASYSTLLMRVAPGTEFELEREVNDWYKVITADGVGYLRAIDGIIVTPK